MDEYAHKKTGLKISACRYTKGLEDGFTSDHKPFVIAWDMGIEKEIKVTKDDYIVLFKNNISREFTFVHNKKLFEKTYNKVVK